MKENRGDYMSRTLNPDAVKFADEIKHENPSVEKWLDNLGEPRKIKKQSFIKKLMNTFFA